MNGPSMPIGSSAPPSIIHPLNPTTSPPIPSKESLFFLQTKNLRDHPQAESITKINKAVIFSPPLLLDFWENTLPSCKTIQAKKTALEDYLVQLQNYQKKNWVSEFFFKLLGLNFKGLAEVHTQISRVKEALNELEEKERAERILTLQKQIEELQGKQPLLNRLAEAAIGKNFHLYADLPDVESKLGSESGKEISEQCGFMMKDNKRYAQVLNPDIGQIYDCHTNMQALMSLKRQLENLSEPEKQ